MGSNPEIVSIYTIESIFKFTGSKCIIGLNAYYLNFGKKE